MKTGLRFHSLVDLWQFKKTVQLRTVEIVTGELILIGEFSEAEMELAKYGYKAEVVEKDVIINTGATQINQ